MASTRNNNKIINLAANVLRIHPLAQRKIVESHLRRIMADLDLDAIGTIHVVQYPIGGEIAYWVIDGQHRVQALMRHGFGEWKVKCEIHECNDDAAASALFIKLNRRAAVGAFDLFLNQLNAHEPVALAIKDICDRSGLQLDRQARDGNICCVNALRTLYLVDDGATLKRTLAMLLSAAGHTQDAVDGQLILGLGRFLAAFNGQVDDEVMTKKLAKYPGGPAGVIGSARGLRKLRVGKSISACITELLSDSYNSGRRVGRLKAPA